MSESKQNDGGPAFPNVVPEDFKFAHGGMSLRDWFAGQALAGIMGTAPAMQRDMSHPDKLAAVAYALSDAMLAERAKAARHE